MDLIKAYYRLTKPGIIYGNAITAAAGFFLASKGRLDFWLLIATLLGISLVIACGCVFNNYIDRGIDEKMSRTKSRELVSGAISARNAIVYASLLGIIGFLILGVYVNLLTVLIGLVGLLNYVILYGISKRRGVYGTIVGSISGATPIVGGYTSVSGQLDGGVLILFLILIFWQMPHFYSIAIYRLNDYMAARLPVLPVKKGNRITKLNMLVYIIGFIASTLSLTAFGYTGYIYAITVAILGLIWLNMNLQGFKTSDDKLWARKMFLFSLVTIATFSVTISADAWLA